MTHCTIAPAPAPARKLLEELLLLDSDAEITRDAGGWYVQLPFSHQLLGILTRRGYAAAQHEGTIRVSP